MKQLLHLLLLMFLVPAIGAQSERDEYDFGETGAPKDYDAKTDIPKDYDPETDESRSYDASKDTHKDYEVTGDLPNDYDETTAKPEDFDEKTDKAQDYDEDYVEGIIYEPGGRGRHAEIGVDDDPINLCHVSSLIKLNSIPAAPNKRSGNSDSISLNYKSLHWFRCTMQ